MLCCSVCDALCCASLCYSVFILCCAEAATGKDAYFLANDPKLLEIMQRQGLHFAVHTIPAVKDGRLGYARSMGDFLDRMMVKSGNVNEACGELPLAVSPNSCRCRKA